MNVIERNRSEINSCAAEARKLGGNRSMCRYEALHLPVGKRVALRTGKLMTLEEEASKADAHPPARDRSARASEEVRSGREEVSDPLHLSRLSTWLNDHASTPFGREQLKDKPLAEGVELE